MEELQNTTLNTIELSLAEILSSLSYALDLTGGQPMGHAQRTCLIAMRIGRNLGLDGSRISSLYHGALLKDAGCSSNAARMYEIFGSDEIAAKRGSMIVDWSNLVEAARYAIAYSLPQSTLLRRAGRLLKMAPRLREVSNEFIGSRCDRGAQIALQLGLGSEAAECIRNLHEHWDGQGAPDGLSGEEIPILGRIVCLAQTLEVFAATFGRDAAYAMLQRRSGRWFDPKLVRAASAFAADEEFWTGLRDDPRGGLLTMDVEATTEVATDHRIESICDAFAAIVDAKSPFTAEHSSRVRDYAVQIAEAFGIHGRRLTTLRRAALLHDIGKLAVPNTILDKQGKPTSEEWETIRRHPYYTFAILKQIRGFERMAEVAAAHHERLDGTGYFRGIDAEQLDLDMRIIAVADVFDALTAERPYRAALSRQEVFRILEEEARAGLDRRCISMLRERYDGRATLPAVRGRALDELMAA